MKKNYDVELFLNEFIYIEKLMIVNLWIFNDLKSITNT